MLEITSNYEFTITLKNTYKANYLANKFDLTSLHKYILAHIYSASFVDEEGLQNVDSVNELYNSLMLITDSDEAEPYEVLFYYEMNKALDEDDVLSKWLEKHPGYSEYCKLNTLSYEFLIHIGMYSAAEKVCNELFYTYRYNYNEYVAKMSDILCKQNKLHEAFEYLIGIIKDTNGYVGAIAFGKAYNLCLKVDRSDEMLELYRWCVESQPHIKWLSRDYISLCLSKDLTEEAQREYERILSVVVFLYKENNNIVTKQNGAMFKFFLTVRKAMGMESSAVAVADELGLILERTPVVKAPKEPKEIRQNPLQENSPWENDFNNKAMLKRVNKMNKPFRTYSKLFAGGERELIHAKSILGSYISIISNRFQKIFGGYQFEITEYNLFYEAFPFYELNGIAEEEIDSIALLLKKLHAITIQLNPFVTSRSFVLEPIVADILSVNTEINLGNKVFKYSVADAETSQITVFGVFLLISTFLNDVEKKAFAFDLAGYDPKLSEPFESQILNTIPSTTTKAEDNCYGDLVVFSLFIRKEMFRFLMELEAAILKKHELVDANRPNMNAMSFNQMLELDFTKDSNEFNSLSNLHYMASLGLLIGDEFNRSKFSVERIVNILYDCVDNTQHGLIMQAGIEALFMVSMNRKYYNLLKWKSNKLGEHFLKRTGVFSQKMINRNRTLLTEDDEYALYDCSREHMFTYLDDFQRKEFPSLFGNKAIEWEKVEYEIYHVDLARFEYSINGELGEDEYFMLKPSDAIAINRINSSTPAKWLVVEEFDTPIAHCEIKEAT